MAKKKKEEIKNLSQEELKTRLRESEKALFDAKIQQRTGQLKNTATLWKTRKQIARIKTSLGQMVR